MVEVSQGIAKENNVIIKKINRKKQDGCAEVPLCLPFKNKKDIEQFEQIDEEEYNKVVSTRLHLIFLISLFF